MILSQHSQQIIWATTLTGNVFIQSNANLLQYDVVVHGVLEYGELLRQNNLLEGGQGASGSDGCTGY